MLLSVAQCSCWILEVMLWLSVILAHVGPAPRPSGGVHLWKAKCGKMEIPQMEKSLLCPGGCSYAWLRLQGLCWKPIVWLQGFRNVFSQSLCSGEISL